MYLTIPIPETYKTTWPAIASVISLTVQIALSEGSLSLDSSDDHDRVTFQTQFCGRHQRRSALKAKQLTTSRHRHNFVRVGDCACRSVGDHSATKGTASRATDCRRTEFGASFDAELSLVGSPQERKARGRNSTADRNPTSVTGNGLSHGVRTCSFGTDEDQAIAHS